MKRFIRHALRNRCGIKIMAEPPRFSSGTDFMAERLTKPLTPAFTGMHRVLGGNIDIMVAIDEYDLQETLPRFEVTLQARKRCTRLHPIRAVKLYLVCTTSWAAPETSWWPPPSVCSRSRCGSLRYDRELRFHPFPASRLRSHAHACTVRWAPAVVCQQACTTQAGQTGVHLSVGRLRSDSGHRAIACCRQCCAHLI